MGTGVLLLFIALACICVNCVNSATTTISSTAESPKMTTVGIKMAATVTTPKIDPSTKKAITAKDVKKDVLETVPTPDKLYNGGPPVSSVFTRSKVTEECHLINVRQNGRTGTCCIHWDEPPILKDGIVLDDRILIDTPMRCPEGQKLDINNECVLVFSN